MKSSQALSWLLPVAINSRLVNGQSTASSLTGGFITAAPTPTPMPLFCTTEVFDPRLSSTYLSTESCYTHTYSKCKNTCLGGKCRQVEWYANQQVPCSTKCCPSTPTVTKSDCTICESCPPAGTNLVPASCKYNYRDTPSAHRTVTLTETTSVTRIRPTVWQNESCWWCHVV
ncbi:hypothetical protein B0H66DRAFT_558905 [Apodospora peruviana]|uniref:Uncharacterized protein n=1 Tax=Apodospora peruviana TaxID=516989 RepID=A0AAE0M585_9PEZI|nr:hypothetical protein B0H66DRAFT_558905 [Apodospora peruviana]